MMKKVSLILFSSGILIAFSIFVPEVLSQKSKASVEATDFALDLIALYLNVDETDEAIRILEKLSDTYPQDYDIRLYLGVALFKKKEYKAAYREFRSVESLYESRRMGKVLYFPFSYKNLGLLYYGMGITLLWIQDDFKDAKDKFIYALKKGHDEVNARYLLAYSYLKLGNYKKASIEMDNIMKRKEADCIDFFLKGYLKYGQGLGNEAVSCFKNALEMDSDLIIAKKNLAKIYYNKRDWDKAVEIWRSIIEKFPKDIEVNLNIARAYYYLGREEEAEKIFENLNISIPVEKYSPSKIHLALIPWERWATIRIKYQVDYDRLLKERNLEELKKRGIAVPRLAALFLNEKALHTLRKDGKIGEAVKILNIAKEIDKKAYFICFNLGQLYLNLGELEQAEANAWHVIQSKNNFHGAYDLLGNIYFLQGKHEEALKEFKRVIDISESDAVGHYNLGCAFWELGDLNNAEKEWKLAVAYDLETTKGEKVKRVTQGEFGYSIIVQNKPVAYRAHNSLGSLYRAKGLRKKAIGEYEKAIKGEPDNPEAYFALGFLYFKHESWDKAKFYLLKHIELGGQNQNEAQRMINSIK